MNLNGKRVSIYCDGAVRNNGNHDSESVYSFMIVNETDNKVELMMSRREDGLTNNMAEYKAVILGLNMLLAYFKNTCEKVTVYSDSELVVRQINGQYQVKDMKMQVLNSRVKEIIRKISNLEVIHLRRDSELISVVDGIGNKILNIKNM